MTDILKELLITTTSLGSGENLRSYKVDLWRVVKDALPLFKPLLVGSTEQNPIQVIDFFSGAGGMSLGFAAINAVIPLFRFLGGCDINATSAASYAKNFGTSLICRDIIKISESPEAISEFLAEIQYDPAKPTILIGCAPCQGFTSHRKKHWNEEDDDRNSLVIAFSRIVAKVKPVAFLMENVPEFLSKKYWKYFSRALTAFIEAGYTVKQNIYNAAAFGVPQERFRSIVIGMNKSFLLPEGVYEVKEYKTVRDAIGNLPSVDAGKADSNDTLHKAVAHKPNTIEIIKQVPRDGGNLPSGVGPECLTRVKGFSDVYGRLSWDKPSITITHYARNPASGRYTHPTQDRGITAREAARLQSFPDGFQFEGKSDDIYRQIGEAVPPLLACAVALNVLVELVSAEPTVDEIKSGVRCVDLPVSNSYSSVIAGIKNGRGRA